MRGAISQAKKGSGSGNGPEWNVELYRDTLSLSVDVKEGGDSQESCVQCSVSAVSVTNLKRKFKESEGAPSWAECPIKPCPWPGVSQVSAC